MMSPSPSCRLLGYHIPGIFTKKNFSQGNLLKEVLFQFQYAPPACTSDPWQRYRPASANWNTQQPQVDHQAPVSISAGRGNWIICLSAAITVIVTGGFKEENARKIIGPYSIFPWWETLGGVLTKVISVHYKAFRDEWIVELNLHSKKILNGVFSLCFSDRV